MMGSRMNRAMAALGAAMVAVSASAQHEGHGHGEGHGERDAAQPERAKSQRPSDPYPLSKCPVSDGALGSMGDPVVKEYDGREVKFCCAGCIGRFEGDQAGYWKKVDEQMIREQLPYYPLSVCVVTGEPLVVDGKDVGVNFVYRNRLVRFSRLESAEEFKKDPERVLKRLDATAIRLQGKHYPIKTCVVSGEELGSMGEPIDLVINSRLVRLCCKGCEKSLRKSPLETLAKLDEAWKHQGFPQPTNRPVSDHDGPGGHGRSGG